MQDTNNFEILKNVFQRVLIPKYPFIKIKDIEMYNFSKYNEYDLRLTTKTKIEPKIQEEIQNEVTNLFRMIGLDKIEEKKSEPNKILVWFKTPNSKNWSFHSTPSYVR